MVDDIIDLENKSWNLNLINSSFLPLEAEIIGGIPLSNWLLEDKQIWGATSNGLFTVRSAYQIAMDLNRKELASSTSNDSGMRLFWRKLWKINFPHKIRYFDWRVAKDILPTKANLVHQHVLLDDTCEECGLMSKSMVHFFWECPSSHHTWMLSKLFQTSGPSFALLKLYGFSLVFINGS